jgi:hypothetical protein
LFVGSFGHHFVSTALSGRHFEDDWMDSKTSDLACGKVDLLVDRKHQGSSCFFYIFETFNFKRRTPVPSGLIATRMKKVSLHLAQRVLVWNAEEVLRSHSLRTWPRLEKCATGVKPLENDKTLQKT